uniref:Uncharacterized protein n=1 Tax=Chlorobium phaeobacteroides (strain BS1) TaxID=331678 RepID=B3EP82_CHLPB
MWDVGGGRSYVLGVKGEGVLSVGWLNSWMAQ